MDGSGRAAEDADNVCHRNYVRLHVIHCPHTQSSIIRDMSRAKRSVSCSRRPCCWWFDVIKEDDEDEHIHIHTNTANGNNGLIYSSQRRDVLPPQYIQSDSLPYPVKPTALPIERVRLSVAFLPVRGTLLSIRGAAMLIASGQLILSC